MIKDDFSEKMLALTNKDCEEAVIGALIKENAVYYEIGDLLTSEVFTSPKYRYLFKCISNMVVKGEAADLVTLTTYTIQHPAKDIEIMPYDIVEIASSVASTVTARQNAVTLRDLWQRRQTLLILAQLENGAADRSKDIADTIDEAAEKIRSVGDNVVTSISTASDAIRDLDETIQKQLQGETVGTLTGIACIDERGGFRSQALTIIAGYPGQGKSAMALQAAISAAVEGGPVAYYTLEMSKAELMARAIAADSGVNLSLILNRADQMGETDWQRYRTSAERLRNLPIYFDEKATASVDGIIQSARTLVRKHHIKGIFVDYLQILVNNHRGQKSDEAFLGDTVRAFKNLAKSENIFVVLLSQLSRDHNSKEPSPDYLRGSGQIFEGCDNCYMIFRPEVTGGRYTGVFSDVDPHGTAQIQVAKCRNGSVGEKYILGFAPEVTKFFELDGQPPKIGGVTGQSEKKDIPF